MAENFLHTTIRIASQMQKERSSSKDVNNDNDVSLKHKNTLFLYEKINDYREFGIETRDGRCHSNEHRLTLSVHR